MFEYNFSSIIRKLRRKYNFSSATVADKLFLDRTTYSHYEIGDRIPSIETIIRLSIIYKIHPLELFYALIPEDIRELSKEMIGYNDSNNMTFTEEEMSCIRKLCKMDSKEIALLFKIVKALIKYNL